MTHASLIDVLNDLLAAEQASLIHRLGEARPYVDEAAAGDWAAVEQLIADEAAHERDLAAMIQRLGGAPSPSNAATETGGLHYVALRHLMPDVRADLQALIAAYEAATGTGDANGDALITRNLTIYRRHQAAIHTVRAEPPR